MRRSLVTEPRCILQAALRKIGKRVKATITDVARHAGVSMKTVSRVLNDEPNVTDKTRKKVRAAAEELRYRPNLAARGLAGSKSYLIALLYDNPSAEYIANIQQGATDACREKGFHLMVEPLDMQGGDLTTDMELLLERLPVDGVILTPPLSDSQRLLTVLESNGTSYVRVAPSTDDGSMPSVAMDDEAAAFEMTNYLLGSGHKDIAFIIGHVDHSASSERLGGYRRAMKEAGITVNEDWVQQGDFSFASGKKCAEILLGGPRRPTAVFASNDDMAAAVISIAGQKGLRVPEDISVCGFDDTALASVLWPPLTTVRQPIHDMGSQAARLLIKGVTKSSDPMPPLMLDHDVILRASTRGL